MEVDDFTVLVVADHPDPERLPNFADELRHVACDIAADAADLFWFTTSDRVRVEDPQDFLFSEIWTTGTGERGSIF